MNAGIFINSWLTRLNLALLLLAVLLVFSGCSFKTEKPVMQYAPHMHSTPALKAQEGYPYHKSGSSMLVPPEGTIPRGFTPYRIKDVAEAARKLRNPLKRSRETLMLGKKLYGINCQVCHGDLGLGDGPVVPPYPIPKSLQSLDARKYKDGHIFHVITRGQGVMPSYATQIEAKDRWAIIHYLRALQRAYNPGSADLKAWEKRKAAN